MSGPLRCRGLTLVELVVALAVFAILGTLTWRGTAQLVDGGAAVDRELERWREIGRALHIIESELLQVVAPAAASG
ncbi:MAG TPA: prepilin-type N-terminal cleavage/methylation domain-containing protein, partial [Rhodocyclaceae bacterium]|nr:prepilin-type N-terminal cleavage/methylation domain-containing protein [Rhodocyclaceae bacterium]